MDEEMDDPDFDENFENGSQIMKDQDSSIHNKSLNNGLEKQEIELADRLGKTFEP